MLLPATDIIYHYNYNLRDESFGQPSDLLARELLDLADYRAHCPPDTLLPWSCRLKQKRHKIADQK